MTNETRDIKSTPKDVFFYLLNILAFYISTIAFIVLYVQYVNSLFPDPLTFYYTALVNSVRWATSVLFVAVPVYILTSWFLAGDLAKDERKRELKLRKWLIYLTLFVSAITIIVDLITFIYNFLGGELTIQFFLKIFVVLLVAAAVFGYYSWELRRKDSKSNLPKIFAWTVSIVVLASIVVGFFIVGTPATQRDRRFDERRVGDLQSLQGQIIYFWTLKEKLPQNLDELEDGISGFVVPTDPNSKTPYTYNVLGELNFELCAEFKTDSDDMGIVSREAKSLYYYGGFGENWSHEKGKNCFSRNIDPELYKKDNSPVLPVPVR